MKSYSQDGWVTIYHRGCQEILPSLAGIDTVITDPPYNLTSITKRFGRKDSAEAQWGRDGAFNRLSKGFMGQLWDGTGISFQPETWKLILDACKSGAHLLAFGGTRTFHRLACAIEDAGWEIRDTMMWVYGQGFPKSLNVGKAIDKLQENEREVIGKVVEHDLDRKGKIKGDMFVGVQTNVAPHNVTRGNSIWEGWGTALKPAWEPIILARKPLEGTVAENVLKYGTGALNIDGCRIPAPEGLTKGGCTKYGGVFGSGGQVTNPSGNPQGRFPANLIHDGSDEVLVEFPNSSGGYFPQRRGSSAFFGLGDAENRNEFVGRMGDSGSASRFFYCAKASRAERGEDNKHPTVKPLALMRYLIKLITPPNGVILDPFMGSGSTLVAARQLGFRAIGIEIDEKYCEIAVKRCGQARLEEE